MIHRFSNFFILFCLSMIMIACYPKKPIATQNTLRISVEAEPLTLDPRQARDLSTATAIHLLYEGLFRSLGNEKPEPALAESYTLSDDLKTYTFKIRPSLWSDGTPITAADFKETWESVLNPSYAAPNAYQLYVIKNAQLAKEGKVNIDQVGIHTPDASTLVVELENPTPYFLELLSNHFFYPVSKKLRSNTALLTNQTEVVTNGPYKIAEWKKGEFTAIPNPHYWDKEAVHLEKISFILLDNPTAYQLYQKDGLEWTGSPLATLPVDALQVLKQSGHLKVKPSAGVHLLRLNTAKAPFDNAKLRRAFAYALNRQELVEHVLQGNQLPAMGVVPPSELNNNPLFEDNNLALARSLFKEYLAENNMILEEFPPIAIFYANGERAHKTAQVAQQQWKEAFDVVANLQSVESKVFFSQIKSHDYQIGVGSWYADFQDPISFLEIFKYKNNGTNNTEWENTAYIDLLDESTTTSDSQKRKELLIAAEKVLMDEMPVIPLFFNSYNYLQKPEVKDVYFSELGYLDFKHASIKK
jgi:oligopeptide transport system substrate-binding protein